MRPGFDLEGKRVLVVGLARTGVATALFCAGYGAKVNATDIKTEDELREVAAKLQAAGVALALGPNAAVELGGTGSDCRQPRGASETSLA